jgi:hypothetical protein
MNTPNAMHRSNQFLSICLGLNLISYAAVSATDICETCPDPNRFQHPGVGFGLTLDYG